MVVIQTDAINASTSPAKGTFNPCSIPPKKVSEKPRRL
jgi:hypothetical protein